jgi:hypothetical protein
MPNTYWTHNTPTAYNEYNGHPTYRKIGPINEYVGTFPYIHIYKLSSNNLQLNDTYTDTHNPIFNLIKITVTEKINTGTTLHHTTPTPPTPYPQQNQKE